MQTLNYEVLEQTGYRGYLLKEAPVKVMQFGEGNFLRAFADYWFDLANERAGWNGKVCMVQPRGRSPQTADLFNRQQGLYTLYLRGIEKGLRVDRRRVISSVAGCVCPYADGGWQQVLALARSPALEIIVSNTTEAGIAYTRGDSRFDETPPASFPAKLTRVLYERWKAFDGASGKGLVILSCELIDNNGRELQNCCNAYAGDWALEAAFVDWMNSANIFCSTLVDRIVPGQVRDAAELAALERANGYRDQALDVGEAFGIWVIEGPAWLEEKLPFQKAGANVLVVPDVTPYKKRKVRILNGAHTGFVPGAYLAGFDIVRDCMHNSAIRGFMNRMLHEEIIPTLPLDKTDLTEFAEAVQDRFSNPFIDHELLSISLNSTSKWRARNLPSFLEYVQARHELPRCLTMSLAAYIAFYSSDIQERAADGLLCRRPGGDLYKVRDDGWVLDFYYARRNDPAPALVQAVLSNTRMWDQDLTAVPGLEAAVLAGLEQIRTRGAEAAFASCL